MIRLTAVALVLILTACASNEPAPLPPEPTVITKYVYADCDQPPERKPIHFLPVRWKILEVNGVQLFTLTSEQYENLGHNTSENIAGVKELKAEIKYYVDCLERQSQQQ